MSDEDKGLHPSWIVDRLKKGVEEDTEEEGDINSPGDIERRIDKLEKRLKEANEEEREQIENKIKELKRRRREYMSPRRVVQRPPGSDVSNSQSLKKKKSEEGIEIPETGTDKGIKDEEEAPEISNVDEYYSLVPRNPEGNEDVYAYAHIHWDDNKGSLIYDVVEPTLSERDKKLVGEIKENIEERLDVDFDKLGKIEAESYLRNEVDDALDSTGIKLEEEERKAIKYYLERDFLGLGKIEPFMRDPNIEDISCDGTDIPVYVWHRNPRYGSIETNIEFEDGEELDSFVRKLVQNAGKTISMADPLVDAALPDGSRLQATLKTDIARRGSNFTIRKFTENPLTPVDLIEFGTIDPRTLAYLWFLVESQKSILVAGGTATGKTTMLNVITLFIRPEMKIVTIEDTPELRLPHDHWVPEVARESITSEKGEGVDMYRLLKESLRQRPDYITVGEVRGKEAFVLFQQMATGHPGFSTIHSENLERLVDRLTTEPINLPPSLIENLDSIVFLKKTTRHGSTIRRVNEVLEMDTYDRENDMPVVNQVFGWDPEKDKLDAKASSTLLRNIANERAMDEDEIMEEMEDRVKVIEWLVEKSIRSLDSINKVIEMYYTDKERLMERIEFG